MSGFRVRVFVGVFALLAVVALGANGCKSGEKPVEFKITVPEPNTLGFDAELTQRYGLGLNGDFPILDLGSIYLRPETTDHLFQFGFTLNTAAFMPESWGGFKEVTALPSGAAFPEWMTGPVVDVVIDPLNLPAVNWHFYFGTRGQLYVGVAAVIPAIGQGFPSVNIGYTFYDAQGRPVLGLLFFGPTAASPGGIFIGSNLTPFLPPGFVPGAGEGQVSTFGSSVLGGGVDALELVSQVEDGQVVTLNGESVVADVQVAGRDSGKYKSDKQIRGLVDRFSAASRKR